MYFKVREKEKKERKKEEKKKETIEKIKLIKQMYIKINQCSHFFNF